MPLPLELRNPNLVARVDAELERARLRAGLASGETAALGNLGIAAMTAEAARDAKEAGVLPGSGLEQITDPETRAVFENSFIDSRELYGRVGITAPTAAEFAAQGIDFAHLAEAYRKEQTAGRRPEVVLAAYVGWGTWEDIYESLEDDNGVNYDGGIKEGGLSIGDMIEIQWDALVNPSLMQGGSVIEHADDRTHKNTWSLRIIPGTQIPTEVDVDHYANGSNHPTIPEYLTLQATRLQDYKLPLDYENFVWLAGTFSDGSLAPYGDWSPAEGRVRLYYGTADDGRFIGARPPVW